MNIPKIVFSFCLIAGLSSCDPKPDNVTITEPTVQAPAKPSINNISDIEQGVAKEIESGLPGQKVTITNIDMDSLKETLPKGIGLNDDQQRQLWDQNIHKQMKGVLNIMCREYRKGGLEARNKLSTSPSGLKTLTVQKGPGKQVKDDSYVSIQFVAMTTEGVEFDHFFMKDRYYRFKIGGSEVVPGLEEGVKQLREGGKAVFFIPANLAYGDKGRVGVPPNAEVAYLVSLAEVN